MGPVANDQRRAAIVYNPVKVDLVRVRTAVGLEERRSGWLPSTWHPTSLEDSGRSAARAAILGEPSVVIVAGGDGTVRAVAESLHGDESPAEGRTTPIALLPSGTGNLLARNLRLPLGDVERSIRTAFTGTLRHIDIAVADLEDEHGGRRRGMFLVMAGIGLDAEMAENTSAVAKQRLGWLAYVSPIARSIIANRQFHLHYRVDGGHTRSTRAHTVIVGNCGTLAGNMLLLPDAVVDDGLLDVVMFRPRNGFGWARVGARLTLQGLFRRSRLTKRLRRLAPELRALAYAQAARFDVHFDTAHGIELDGDSAGTVVRARITVRAGALAIRLPADQLGVGGAGSFPNASAGRRPA